MKIALDRGRVTKFEIRYFGVFENCMEIFVDFSSLSGGSLLKWTIFLDHLKNQQVFSLDDVNCLVTYLFLTNW